MANRRNHYESAFEAFLQNRRVPYVAVTEARRSRLPNGETIKNLDFLVSPPGRETLLIDIKGRRFPSGFRQPHYWKHWTTRDDLDGLTAWQSLFGVGFRGMFVFAFDVVADRSPVPETMLFDFRDHRYAFIGIRLEDFLNSARMISPRWHTYALPLREFRRRARPFEGFLAPAAPIPAQAPKAVAELSSY
jgi:hypothetical protein